MKARATRVILTILCLNLALAGQGLAEEVQDSLLLVAREGVRVNGAAFVELASTMLIVTDSRITYTNINGNDAQSILITAVKVFRPDGGEETSLSFPFTLPLTLGAHESTGFDLSETGVSSTTEAEPGGFIVRTEWRSVSGRRVIGLQSATAIFLLDPFTSELIDQEVVQGVDLPRRFIE